MSEWMRRFDPADQADPVQPEVDPESNNFLPSLHQAMVELSSNALRDPYAMNAWNETFPGVCPGCFKPHAEMLPLIHKGICVKCHLKVNAAKKQLDYI